MFGRFEGVALISDPRIDGILDDDGDGLSGLPENSRQQLALQGILEQKAAPVGAVRDHCVEGVDDADDPRAQRDLAAGQACIPPAVRGPSSVSSSSTDFLPKFLVSSISRSPFRIRSRRVWMLAFLRQLAERTERSSLSIDFYSSLSMPLSSSGC